MVTGSNTRYNFIGDDLKVLEKKTKKNIEDEADKNIVIPKGTANPLQPDLLTTSIDAGEADTWMDKWEEYKINSAFGRQG